MYRKDKVAIAVDNYKRKRDDGEEEEAESNAGEDEEDSEEEYENGVSEHKNVSNDNEISHEIESVKANTKVLNKDQNNQVQGFNMFLETLKKPSRKSAHDEEDGESRRQKRVDFHVIDPHTRYLPPHPLTVTSISQSHSLHRGGKDLASSSSTEQSSVEWLKTHGLERLNLSIETLISKGRLGDPRPDEETGDAVNCLIYDEFVVTEFEYKVHVAIEMYSKRIKWCLQGSRKLFGLVGGGRVGLLLDCSDAALGMGRQRALQDNLMHFLDEQLGRKTTLQLCLMGSDVSMLWQAPMTVNCRVLEEAALAIGQISPMGGCNLLQGLKQMMHEKNLDQLVVVLGSVPDQEASLLLDFVQQLILGRDLPIHCVAYDTAAEEINHLLRRLAELSTGNYHRYSSVTEELLYTSNDVDLLLQEIERAQEVLSKVHLMRQGLFTNRTSPIVAQIAREIRSVPQADFLPQPESFGEPLTFEVPKFQPTTSDDWLHSSGLKAKKLGLFSSPVVNAQLGSDALTSRRGKVLERKSMVKPVPSTRPFRISNHMSTTSRKTNPSIVINMNPEYSIEKVEIVEEAKQEERPKVIENFTKKVLGPNSYESKTEYVPSIGKLVTSSVYERAMIQVAWPDGSERNVHADLAQLFEYQKLLGEQVKLMEQRINWLASGSRRLFGTIVERHVVFILDLSLANLKYLVHIQHSLKMLLQQQLVAQDKFNLVAFNQSVVCFRPHLVRVTEDALQQAWQWIRGLACGGSRNFLGALKAVLENPVDAVHDDLPHGIYLFTSGVPDQSLEPLTAYIEERLLGSRTKLHTVLFNVDDYDSAGTPIPSRYASITNTAETMRTMAHQTRGRFHWFRETGIIESDDVRILMAEIDLAVEYSRRTQQIIKDFKEKYPNSVYKRNDKSKIKNEADICRRESSDNMVALPPPRQTSLSLARLNHSAQRREEELKVPKTLAYQAPNTVAAKTDPLKATTSVPHVLSAFYTEDGNAKGVVYRNNTASPATIVAHKYIGKTEIPNKEEWMSSRDWMKKYSLRAMSLNLLRLVSGPDCRHEEGFVVPIEKFAEAKYCDGLFPIVNVRGTRKHMQFTPVDLSKYDKEAQKALLRYLKRLEWLMIGSTRIFSVITEPAVAILLDTSGSMNPHMAELILSLKALIWEQLFKRKISFNLVAFNSQIQRFRERLVLPDEVNCHSAVGWAEHLTANGNTDTLKAIMVTLEDPRIQGVYLLSDGKPDSSTDLVLRTVREQVAKRDLPVVIHTISFNCEDPTAHDFMRSLSRITRGRYHKVCHEYDIRMFTQRVVDQCRDVGVQASFIKGADRDDHVEKAAKILSVDPYYPPMPDLHGDDLARIAKEIQVARVNLSKTSYFRHLYYEMRRLQKERKKKTEESVKLARQQLSRRL